MREDVGEDVLKAMLGDSGLDAATDGEDTDTEAKSDLAVAKRHEGQAVARVSALLEAMRTW